MRILLALLIGMWLAAGGARAQAPEPGWHGLTVETVTPQVQAARQLMFPFGALVTAVEAASPAAGVDIRAGDVVIAIGTAQVADAAALMAQLDKLGAGTETRLARMRGALAEPVTLRLAARPRAPEPVTAGAAPRLMLDTGGHQALIRGLAWTPDGRQLVSAGEDKVIRVWDAATGRTVRTIRGEVGAGDEGKIFAMALSPDGRWLAVGGWMKIPGQDGHHIRLHDFATGEQVSLLKGHTNVVFGLAFAPDGRRLLSGQAGGDNRAILWEAGPDAAGGWRAGRLLHRLEGHTDHIYAVGFTPDGQRAVTGSYDRTLRLWDVAGGKPIGPAMAGHADKVQALAVNPSDGSIVSGSDDGEIRVWDGRTGRFVRTLGKQGGTVGRTALTPDGTRLLSTCGFSGCNYAQRIWELTTGKETRQYTAHDNIVLAAAISPDGRWAVTGGGNQRAIHIWSLDTGERRRGPDGQPLTLGGAGAPGWAAGFSADGQRIAWGNTWTQASPVDRGPLQYQLRLPTAGTPLGRPEAVGTPSPLRIGGQTHGSDPIRDPIRAGEWLRARASQGAWSLAHRPGGRDGNTRDDGILDIRRDGRTVASITRGSTDGYRHRAYTLTPDGRAVVSGGANGRLIAYDLAGKALADFVGHEGDVWAVTPSADGRLLVTGSADQTIRLWRLAALADPDVVPTQGRLPPKKVHPIVTLFPGRDGEWAMWTEQGYYTGSANAGRIVGWQLNNGPDRKADYVTAAQVRDVMLRPDIVENAIRLASSEAALEAAGLEGTSIDTLLRRRPPVIRVDGADKPLSAFGGKVTLTVFAEPNRLAVDDIAFSVTGPAGGVTGGETRVTARPASLPFGTAAVRGDGTRATAYEVPLFAGANTVRVVARNAGGESAPALVTVNHTGEGALDKRGTLWIVAAGVDKYPGAKVSYGDLDYAGKDAEALAATAAATMAFNHTHVEPIVLVNGRGAAREPTRANILAALARVAREAGDTDTVLLFLAGHGENWAGGRYHFLPTDLERTSKTDKGHNVIDWKDDVEPALRSLKGRRIVLLDACYAGSSRNQTLTAEAQASQFTAFQAADGAQEAWEFASEGHGAFTFALMQGLRHAPEALDPARQAVTVYRLGPFVRSLVEAKTGGAQTPEYLPGAGDFVLARR